jgi:thioredoxin reductase (NADPH)
MPLCDLVIDVDVEGDIKIVKTENKHYKTKALILATGAYSRPLGLEGEDKYIGSGVSYCATCDGNFFKNKEVAVVGGGDTALEDALYLSNTCNKVYLIHRRDEFKGNQVWVEDLKKKENVEFILNANVTKLIGDSVLKEIEVTNNLGEVRNIDVACLFIAVGQTPGNGAFENIVNLDEKGYIEAGENCLTNVKGIFVAGDTRSKVVRQLTTACADGAVAALAAVNYIR